MALIIERFYWLPHCTTCQKAEQYLKDKGVQIKKYIDVKTQQVSKEEIQELTQLMGSVEGLFSKRAMKYRSMGLDKMTLTDDDMLHYMHEEYTFIKRPVLVTKHKKILAGFSKKQYDTLI
jgi:arsenate reductase (glutaredoxin)